MARCPKCGNENDAAFRFCGDCGTKLNAEYPPPQTAEPEPITTTEYPHPADPQGEAEVEAPTAEIEASETIESRDQPATINCPECAKENATARKFCDECGAGLHEEPAAESIEVIDLPADPHALEHQRITSYLCPVVTTAAMRTHNGWKKTNQEDRGRILRFAWPSFMFELFVLIAIDGIGGFRHGELAAEIALNTIATSFHRIFPFLDSKDLEGKSRWSMWQELCGLLEQFRSPIKEANFALCEEKKRLKIGKFGTTDAILTVLVDRQSGTIKARSHNIGDAWCGVVIGDRVITLSNEHTTLGQPSRWLGQYVINDRTEFGVEDGTINEFNICLAEEIAEPLCFVAATDGVTEHVSNSFMIQSAKRSRARLFCAQLMHQALRVGKPVEEQGGSTRKPGHDNATVTALTIAPAPEQNEEVKDNG